MAHEILLHREGNNLCPSDRMAFDCIADMGQGECRVALIKQARHPKHHRKFMKLLQEIVNNQNFYFHVEDLLDDIKIAVGHYEERPCKYESSGIRKVPKSISFANMGQDKFAPFYDEAIKYIISEVIPGLNRQDLENHLLEIIN